METQPLTGPIREEISTENGYSEEEQAKVIEGAQVDIKQLKKRKPAASLNRQAKILEVYNENHQKILGLLSQLPQTSANPRHQEKIVEELNALQKLQEELIQCVLLEEKGELSQTTVTAQAWNLIK